MNLLDHPIPSTSPAILRSATWIVEARPVGQCLAMQQESIGTERSYSVIGTVRRQGRYVWTKATHM